MDDILTLSKYIESGYRMTVDSADASKELSVSNLPTTVKDVKTGDEKFICYTVWEGKTYGPFGFYFKTDEKGNIVYYKVDEPKPLPGPALG